MDFVQKPLKKFLGILLLRPFKLTTMPFNDRLEGGAELGVVLTGPKRFEHESQLLRYLAFGAKFLRVQFIPAAEVHFILIEHKILRENIGMRDAL